MCNGDLEKSVEAVVVALCYDYFRRREKIEKKSVSRRTEIELRYLNIKVYESCADAVGERYCELLIKEIGEKIGFTHSAFSGVFCETNYKRQKRVAKRNIAIALHLIDA